MLVVLFYKQDSSKGQYLSFMVKQEMRVLFCNTRFSSSPTYCVNLKNLNT